MNSKIKNIIIFVVVAIILILAYIFFFKPAPEQATLTTATGNSVLPSTNVADKDTTIGADFLSTLLSVKSINLDDSIFVDSAFATLHDSSILLTPDQTEGRPNPFAPIGSDVLLTNETGILAPASGLGILGTVGATTNPSATGTSTGTGLNTILGTPLNGSSTNPPVGSSN